MIRPSPRALALMLVTAAAVAGCTAGKDYERPQMPTPDQFRFADPAQAQSLADAPWFQVFDDPALQALVKEALANNLDLRAALARVEEARAQAGIAKSFYYPQVDGQFGVAIRGNATDEAGVEDVTEAANYGFNLSWEIDVFGKLRRQREAALAIALASEQNRRGVLVTLIGD